ncbi:MAG TPA: hypothetical protein VK453_25625 [Micromonosporaceae bacterium]|nr:hypothetical protein [Micromonosporaceae bacterium]
MPHSSSTPARSTSAASVTPAVAALVAPYVEKLAAGATPADLVAKLQAGRDYLAGLHHGLVANAPAGKVFDPATDLNLGLVVEFLDAVQRAVATGGVWVDDEPRPADLDATPVYALTADQLNSRDRAAYVRGANVALQLTGAVA